MHLGVCPCVPVLWKRTSSIRKILKQSFQRRVITRTIFLYFMNFLQVCAHQDKVGRIYFEKQAYSWLIVPFSHLQIKAYKISPSCLSVNIFSLGQRNIRSNFQMTPKIELQKFFHEQATLSFLLSKPYCKMLCTSSLLWM